MKKTFLIILLSFCLCHFGNAQIANGSFENWYSDTTTFSFGSYVPLDTFNYTAPVNWTCINSISMCPGLGGKQLVDSSANAYSGSKSLYMYTDTITVSGVNLHLVLPGFAVNGNFHLSLASFFGVANLTPLIFQGAGVPFTQRLKAFGVHMEYMPIPNDSCLLWAVLKKNGQIVADARFSTTQTYTNYTYVEKDFTYYSCEMPDTLVVLLSTSTPNLATLGSGNTGLTGGSRMWLDSLALIYPGAGFNILPAATVISGTTPENTPKTIAILPSDTDCSGLPLTAAVVSAPNHGTATIDSLQRLFYSPAIGFTGRDTIGYSITNGVATSQSFVVVDVIYISSPTCDTLFINHTYNWHNLNQKLSCVTMTGTIQLILPPSQTGDGDAHIYILPDTAYDSLVYSPTTFPTWLNVEETCVGTPLDTTVDPYCRNWTNPLYLPNIGEHVRCTGPWVFDPTHGWNEIHPVCDMELIAINTGVTEPVANPLDGMKIFPQPAVDHLTFQLAKAPHQPTYINFYNMLGRNVAAYELLETNLLIFDTSYWPAGTYVYTISQNDKPLMKKGKVQIVHVDD
jgi:Bacterial Ig domain/Secretion system C-terminal sorting domain